MKTGINWWGYLLDTLLREMINQEKNAARNEITYSLCMYSIQGMDPKQLDPSSVEIKSEDRKRYYVSVKIKDGEKITVPIQKRLTNKKSVSLLKFS